MPKHNDYWSELSTELRPVLGSSFRITQQQACGGGCINESWQIQSADGVRYFLKLNDKQHRAMFDAEYAGLQAIQASQTIRVPTPIHVGLIQKQAFLLLEYLPLQPHGDAALLGAQLAALHHCQQQQFGFLQDNFLGTSKQPNHYQNSWIDFFSSQRLSHQLQLARQNGYTGKLQTLGESLIANLAKFFVDVQPKASLLHGDLWGGNHGYLTDGTPVIFDPACFYGDRECDIAMTELFGGYTKRFYDAYRAHYPLDQDYEQRRELYNLYHILNHANLFGGGYVRQAEQMMQGLLSAVQ